MIAGTVFKEIIRILKYHKPKALLLENVRQLVSHQGGKTFEYMLEQIRAIGYALDYKVLNALDYGLPQKRERVMVVGLLNGMDYFQWPKPKKEYKPLSEILEAKPDKKHFVSDRIRRSRIAAHKSEHKPGIWHENKGGNISSHPFSCALRAGASHNYLLVDGIRRPDATANCYACKASLTDSISRLQVMNCASKPAMPCLSRWCGR